MHMPFSLFLALRYLMPRRSLFSVVTALSVLGVVLGVAILVIVLSVMTGFDEMWHEKVLDFESHVVVRHVDLIDDSDALMEQLLQIDGVVGAAPGIENPVMIQFQNRIDTPVLRGVHPDLERTVSGIPDSVRFGRFSVEGDEIVVGYDLALEMGLAVGDRLLVYSPRNLVSTDEIHLPEELTVAGIFHIGMLRYDKFYVLTSLDTAAYLYDMEEGVRSVRVRLADPDAAHRVAQAINERLGPGYIVRSWMQENEVLFRALSVEKNMMFFLLIIITVVAGFCIANTLIAFAAQKTSDIGLLKAVGHPPARIMGIFLWLGAIQGVIGTIAGIGVGLLALAYRNDLLRWISRVFHVDLLPPELYQWSEIPATTTLGDVGVVAGLVVAIATVAGLAPAYLAARLHPVEALRHE